jgi:hypothetical protein
MAGTDSGVAIVDAIFARDDPRPGLAEIAQLASTLARRLAGGHGV